MRTTVLAGGAVLLFVVSIPMWRVQTWVAALLLFVAIALGLWALDVALHLRHQLVELVRDWRHGHDLQTARHADEVYRDEVARLKLTLSAEHLRPMLVDFAKHHPRPVRELRHAGEEYIYALETLSDAIESHDVLADLEPLHEIVRELALAAEAKAYRARMAALGPKNSGHAIRLHALHEGAAWARNAGLLHDLLASKGATMSRSELDRRLRAEVDDLGLKRSS